MPKLAETNPDMSCALAGLRLDHERDLSVWEVQFCGKQGEESLGPIIGQPGPGAGRSVAVQEGLSCARLAPGEWLLTGRKDLIIGLVAQVEEALRDRLFLATDLTHARTSFRLSGAAARDRIASACPIDLREGSFPIGAAAASLLGKAALFITRLDDQDGAPAYRIIVDQTAARHAASLLHPPVGRAQHP